MPRSAAAVAAATLVALFAPGASVADDGDDEARVRVACAGAIAELRLKAEEDDGETWIAVELHVAGPRRTQTWRVVVLHERTLILRAIRRSTRASGFGFRLRLRLPDWAGEETVAARLSTASGRTCLLEAKI